MISHHYRFFDLDPEITAFLEKSDAVYPPGASGLGIRENRNHYRALAGLFQSPAPDGIIRTDSTIAGRNGPIAVRSYHMESFTAETRVLYIHGGGFMLGDLESHDSICADLSYRTGIRLVSVDYRLAPEFLHPVQIEDTQDAFLSIDAGRTVVVGDSAGGTLAAALCIARQHQDAKPVGQVLIYPALGGLHLDLDSYREKADAPGLTLEDVHQCTDTWCGGRYNWEDPLFAPLLHADLSGMPPAVAIAAEHDPLRDDVPYFVDRLSAAGVPAKAVIEQGLVHGYLRARHMSSKAADSFSRICEAIRELAEPGDASRQRA